MFYTGIAEGGCTNNPRSLTGSSAASVLVVSVFLVCFFSMPSTALAAWFGPSDFSGCVEKYVKGVKSSRAAYILNSTCRMQFDQKKQSADWNSYYDCVRDNLEDVENDNAASLLLRSCQKKHRQLFYIDQVGFYQPIESSSATSPRTIDKDYIRGLQYKFYSMNKVQLPKKLDSATTLEEIRVIEVDGHYYVASMVSVDTTLDTIGATALERVRASAIKTGCADSATIDYMEHGLKIGAIYRNRAGKNIGEIRYSIGDCQ